MSSKRPVFLLVIFLVSLSFILYHDTITFFPSFIHAWTQSERYAVSLQFLNNGFDFLHPATFNLQTVNGITRIDLPLDEFIAALLMKLFASTAPVIFRLYTLVLSITGLTFLYLTVKKITGSEFKSWIAAVFVFLSPVYTYYQAGFIPCVPALSFVFIAYYFFFEYKLTLKRINFYLCILFFLLAALIRIPFFILFFAIVFQQAFNWVRHKKIVVFEAVSCAAAFAVFAIYYRYNVHLGTIYGNMFLNTFLPAKNAAEFKEILVKVYHYWMLQYFTIWHYIMMLICSVITLITFFAKKAAVFQAQKTLLFNLIITSAAAGLYFLLMSRQYYDHDYYFLDSLFIPVVLLFVLTISFVQTDRFFGKIIMGAFVVFAVFMFRDSRKNQCERYTREPWDRVEISSANFRGSAQFLDSIGIPKSAKMLVIDSYSTNIALYLMDRKGYTVYQTSRDDASFMLFWAKWDYVVIQDLFLFSDVLKYYPIAASVIEPLAGNGKITVYKKRAQIKKDALRKFLQIDIKDIVFKAKETFDEPLDLHSFGNSKIYYSSFFGSKAAAFDPQAEFGTALKINAADFKKRDHLKLYAAADILRSENSDVQIAASITNGGKVIYYQSYKLDDYYHIKNAVQKNEFQFVLPMLSSVNDELSVYLWNPSHASFSYDNFEVIIYR